MTFSVNNIFNFLVSSIVNHCIAGSWRRKKFVQDQCNCSSLLFRWDCLALFFCAVALGPSVIDTVGRIERRQLDGQVLCFWELSNTALFTFAVRYALGTQQCWPQITPELNRSQGWDFKQCYSETDSTWRGCFVVPSHHSFIVSTSPWVSNQWPLHAPMNPLTSCTYSLINTDARLSSIQYSLFGVYSNIAQSLENLNFSLIIK